MKPPVLIAVAAGLMLAACAQSSPSVIGSPGSCHAENGGCDENATCIPTAQGVACACKTGFAGDGLTCTAVDQGGACAQDHGGCADQASCADTGNGAVCACLPGYQGDGATCTPEDPQDTTCANDHGGCAHHATCSDGSSGAACSCLTGYEGDGYTCTSLTTTGWVPDTFIKAGNPGQDDGFAVVALSADGATLAVGAPGEDSATTGVNGVANEAAPESGAVYIYVRSGGTWVFQAFIKAPNTGAGDQFGSSLALSGSGDTLVVGAPREDSAAAGASTTFNDDATDSGAAYIYGRVGDTWTFETMLKGNNTAAGDQLGAAVDCASDGALVAIGSFGESSLATGVGGTQNELAPYSGAVYLLRRGASDWSQEAFIKATNPSTNDFFGGTALRLSGDGATLAVGVAVEDSTSTGVGAVPNDNGDNQGAVYVYRRQAGTWEFDAFIKAPVVSDWDFFGYAVALDGDGDTLVVGAPSEDTLGAGINSPANDDGYDGGAAYVYRRSGGAWGTPVFLKGLVELGVKSLGNAVDISSDGATVVAGAPYDAGSGIGVGPDPTQLWDYASGAAQLYQWTGSAWTMGPYVKAFNTEGYDRFGTYLAIAGAGDVLAVGAFGEGSASSGVGGAMNELLPGSGAVYLYELLP